MDKKIPQSWKISSGSDGMTGSFLMSAMEDSFEPKLWTKVVNQKLSAKVRPKCVIKTHEHKLWTLVVTTEFEEKMWNFFLNNSCKKMLHGNGKQK